MNLKLLIDRLILHDLPAHQQAQIAQAIEAELGRLLQSGAMPPGTPRYLSLDSLSLEVDGQQTPEQIGASVASQIYREIGGSDGESQHE